MKNPHSASIPYCYHLRSIGGQKSTFLTTPSHTTMPMADPTQREAISHNVMAAEQWQQWQHFHEFHAGNQPWPADITMHGSAGGSPLIQMMFYPPTAATWLSTYSWTGHRAVLPEIDYLNNYSTTGPPCPSQGKWNSWHDSSWARSPITANNSLHDTHQLQALVKNTAWIDPEITPIFPTPPQQQQWEHMRAFHSSNLLWPSEEGKSQQMDGGLPLIWTMLYPPAADMQCLTYTWTGHLENYMPWKIGQTGATSQPPIILYARWNIQKPTLPQVSVNPSQGPTHTNQEILEKSISKTHINLQQYKKPEPPCPRVRAQPTQQPALNKLNGLLPKNTNFCQACTPPCPTSPTPLCPPNWPHEY